jgi:hypothetical protein
VGWLGVAKKLGCCLVSVEWVMVVLLSLIDSSYFESCSDDILVLVTQWPASIRKFVLEEAESSLLSGF